MRPGKSPPPLGLAPFWLAVGRLSNEVGKGRNFCYRALILPPWPCFGRSRARAYTHCVSGVLAQLLPMLHHRSPAGCAGYLLRAPHCWPLAPAAIKELVLLLRNFEHTHDDQTVYLAFSGLRPCRFDRKDTRRSQRSHRQTRIRQFAQRNALRVGSAISESCRRTIDCGRRGGSPLRLQCVVPHQGVAS